MRSAFNHKYQSNGNRSMPTAENRQMNEMTMRLAIIILLFLDLAVFSAYERVRFVHGLPPQEIPPAECRTGIRK